MAEFDERMAALREIFRARCADQQRDLRTALAATDRDEIVRIAHVIAGSAGMFGFQRLSELAQQVEEEARSGDPAHGQQFENGFVLLEELARTSEE